MKNLYEIIKNSKKKKIDLDYLVKLMDKHPNIRKLIKI